MAPPPEPNTSPYQRQTDLNTDTAWLHDGDYKDVRADLAGMADYAANMAIIRDNLYENFGYLDLLATLPSQAWEPGSLPEGAYASKLMVSNYNELMQYLSFLAQALNNIGSAAQTIAQAYAGTDGWSAADLNSVRFAYGDRSVAPPSGYPQQWLDRVKTWQELYSENMRTGNAAASGVIVNFGEPATYRDASGVHYVYTSPDGVEKHVVERYDPLAGEQVVTTTLTYPPSAQYPDGRVETTQTRSSTTTVGTTTTTTTSSYDEEGQQTGRTVERETSTDGEATSYEHTTYDANDEVTGGTTVTTSDEGQTISTTSGPDDETPEVVHIGAQTESARTGESPYQQAIEEATPD